MKARKKKPGIRAVDPKKKKEDPKPKLGSRREGSAAIIKRNKKGNLEATLKPDFGGITQETMREDRIRKAGTGDGDYNGGPAPRVGGKVEARDGAVRGGTKKMIRKAKRRARNSSASKGARKAAIRAYKI